MTSFVFSLILMLLLAAPQLTAAAAKKAPTAPKPAARQQTVAVPSLPNIPGLRKFAFGTTTYYAMDDVAKRYGMAKSQNQKRFVYASKLARFAFTIDSRDATLNFTAVTLSFAPALVKNTVLISQADFHYYLEPIIRTWSLPRKTVQKIVIDAGHGGKDPGCKGAQTTEKNVNLAVAQSLAAILAKRGYSVAMTRSKDTFLSLQQRVALARKYTPDLFISLHCNAAAPATRGVEVYCATPQFSPASDAKVQSLKQCPAGPYCRQSTYAAYRMQKSLVNALGVPDRGVKRKRYTVISDLPAPSVLVEMGFLSNASDRQILNTRRFSVAVAIADAVDVYKRATAPAKK